MPDSVRRFLKGLLIALLVILIAGIAGAFWARRELHGSLAQLDGSRRVAGLGAPVSIARDRLGIPSIRAASREDVARALGFLHAQDRFSRGDARPGSWPR
jgi:penicillin amidase